jgi:hypothetical protein
LRVAPAPGSLRNGTYTMPTIRGQIIASFIHTIERGFLLPTFHLSLSLPVGCYADVKLPVGSGASALPPMPPTMANVSINSGTVSAHSVLEGYVSVGRVRGGATHTFRLSSV